MQIEFESTPEYRKKHSHFYEAIMILLQDHRAKINVHSVTKTAGYSRSSIRKDRDEWKPLLRDIDVANNVQSQKPHFLVKVENKKNKVISASVKEYKEKYLNLLSAFYDLSRIVEEQSKIIKSLESKNIEQSSLISELKQEIDNIKTNGKVTQLVPAKKKSNK